MINTKDIARIIHLSPARQNQVCFTAEIAQQANRVTVDFKPTLDYLTKYTIYHDRAAMYKSMLFHTGLTVSSLEIWAQSQGLQSQVSVSLTPIQRDHNNLGGWFISLKDQMVGHIVGYIESQRSINDLFKDYTYDVGKCHRDFGLFQNAVYNDLSYNTSCHTVAVANFYWDSQGRAVSRRPQELAIHRSLRDKLALLGQCYDPGQLKNLLDLYDLLIDIIENGARTDSTQWATGTSDTVRIEIYE